MKRGIMFLAALLALASCATGPSLQSRMAAYTGASAETLVQDLGVPDKQLTLNNFQYLAYVRQQVSVTPTVPIFFPYGPFAPYGGFYNAGFYSGGFTPSATVWRCEITFTLQHDKVLGVTLRGNACS